MEPSNSLEPAFRHPELDALEAHMASHPDDLKDLMEVPFGRLLSQIAGFGFDADILKEELVSSGLFSSGIWLESVGLESLDDFWRMTPIQYCEQFPEIGATLVTGVIESIHVSEEQIKLLANAGGKTNLTKSEKWEIAGGAVLVGYVMPKLYFTYKNSTEFSKQTIREIAVKQSVSGEGEFTRFDGFEYRLRANYYNIFNGTRVVTVEAKTLAGRIYFEWGMTLPGILLNKYIKQPLQRYFGNQVQHDISAQISDDILSRPELEEDAMRNIREAEIRPLGELGRDRRFASEKLPDVSPDLVEDYGESGTLLESFQTDLAGELDSQFQGMFEHSVIEIQSADGRIEKFEKTQLDKIMSNEEARLEQAIGADEAQLESDAEADAVSEIDSAAIEVESSIEKSVKSTIVADKQLIDGALDGRL